MMSMQITLALQTLLYSITYAVVGIYLYRRYGRPYLQSVWEAERREEQNIYDSVIEAQKSVKRAERAQREYERDLQERERLLKSWYAAVADEDAQQAKHECTLLMQRVALRQREHALHEQRVALHKGFIRAVNEVSAEAEDFFADATRDHQYVLMQIQRSFGSKKDDHAA